jgi:hypothetical protein
MQFDFLICSERSGSNLITKVMDAHPDVCGPPPSHLIQNMARNLFRYGDIEKENNWRIFLEDAAFLLNHGVGQWVSRFDAEGIKQHIERRNLVDVIRYVYQTEAHVQGKKRLFVKENHTCEFLSYLLTHFPDSRFVWMVRDPRDMAYSLRETPSMGGGARHAAHYWHNDQAKSIEEYGYLVDLERIILIRFEDLLADPEGTARRICGFLSLEYDPEMLEFHKREITVQNAARNRAWADLAKPIIKTNKNLYKTGLSEVEIRYVEAVCGEEMEFLGYVREFEDPGDPDELEKQLPEECMERKYNDIEKTFFPGYFEAVRRITGRRLYGG